MDDLQSHHFAHEPRKRGRRQVAKAALHRLDTRGTPFVGIVHYPELVRKEKQIATIDSRKFADNTQGLQNSRINLFRRKANKKFRQVGNQLFKRKLVLEGLFYL